MMGVGRVKAHSGLGLVRMWRRGVETGSVGIEKKISVFIQPTLESMNV